MNEYKKHVEEIIEEQLKDFRKKFRPVFGDSLHIQIVELTSKLGRLEKELKKKVSKQIKDEIIQTKRALLFTFKKL